EGGRVPRPQPARRRGERAGTGERDQGAGPDDREDRGQRSRPGPAPDGGSSAWSLLLVHPRSAARPALAGLSSRSRAPSPGEQCSIGWNAPWVRGAPMKFAAGLDYATIVSASEKVAWTVDGVFQDRRIDASKPIVPAAWVGTDGVPFLENREQLVL